MARLRGEDAPQTSAPVIAAVVAPAEPAMSPPGPAMQAAAAPAAQPEPARARSRLPDIEEINSSLRAAADRTPSLQADRAAADGDGRAFRYGFSVVLIVAAVATVVYALAAQIGQAMPVLAGPLDAYVARVDDLRLWLDLSLQSLLPGEAPQAVVVPDTPPAAPVTEAPAAPAAPATGG